MHVVTHLNCPDRVTWANITIMGYVSANLICVRGDVQVVLYFQ